jgi:hypothetical protein
VSDEHIQNNLGESNLAGTPTIEVILCEFSNEVKASIGNGAQRLESRIIRHGSRILRGRRLRAEGFEERLYSRWAKPLDLYEICLYLASECGSHFNRHFRSRAALTQDHKFDALIRLQAGAVRVAGEVYSLLLSGYASGEHGRWRTLHEIAAVALFLSGQSRDTSEKYLDHQFVKGYEDAQHQEKHAERFGYTRRTDEHLAKIRKRYEDALQKHGKDFRHDYAWARTALETLDPDLKGQRIGFQHIQKAAKVEHRTPYYRMASMRYIQQPRSRVSP